MMARPKFTENSDLSAFLGASENVQKDESLDSGEV